jgi:hypothetical protein
VTIQKNNASNNNPQPRPIQVKAKAQSSGDPNEIIDRKYVAGALDRPGDDGTAPDGIISDGEFSKAGIKVDQDAKDIINRGGESGDKITVGELSKALSDNTVSITGDGNVRIVDGFASIPNGRLQQASPWTFPDIPGLRTLARVVDLAPTYGDGLDPNNPGYQYTETRRRYVGTFRQGDTLGAGEYVADSNGNELSADANGQYPAGAQVWKRYTVVHWDDLRDELLNRARQISYETSNSRDPEIQQIHDTVQRLLMDSSWGGSSEDQARRLYSGMSYISNIHVPMSPRARMSGLDDSINAAKGALNDHFKILQQVPIERARDVVSREVTRLKSPTAPAKMVGSVVGGLLGGGGLVGLALGGAIALSGGALIGAAAGAGVLGLGLGWLVGKLMNDGRAKEVENDLKTLETISPEKNKQDLQQYSLQAYKLLQDARTVATLAKVRAYDEDAHGVQGSVDTETGKIREQANQLRDIQKLVDKYANK